MGLPSRRHVMKNHKIKKSSTAPSKTKTAYPKWMAGLGPCIRLGLIAGGYTLDGIREQIDNAAGRALLRRYLSPMELLELGRWFRKKGLTVAERAIGTEDAHSAMLVAQRNLRQTVENLEHMSAEDLIKVRNSVNGKLDKLVLAEVIRSVTS